MPGLFQSFVAAAAPRLCSPPSAPRRSGVPTTVRSTRPLLSRTVSCLVRGCAFLLRLLVLSTEYTGTCELLVARLPIPSSLATDVVACFSTDTDLALSPAHEFPWPICLRSSRADELSCWPPTPSASSLVIHKFLLSPLPTPCPSPPFPNTPLTSPPIWSWILLKFWSSTNFLPVKLSTECQHVSPSFDGLLLTLDAI